MDTGKSCFFVFFFVKTLDTVREPWYIGCTPRGVILKIQNQGDTMDNTKLSTCNQLIYRLNKIQSQFQDWINTPTQPDNLYSNGYKHGLRRAIDLIKAEVELQKTFIDIESTSAIS